MKFMNEKDLFFHPQHWQFRECFSWFDRDGDGFIGSMDLPAALRAMGQYWSLYELKNLMKGNVFF
jgi:Ca2+-binding EF-hand superfamily protein